VPPSSASTKPGLLSYKLAHLLMTMMMMMMNEWTLTWH